MPDPNRPVGPRALPGQEAGPVSRAGMAVVGVVIVVALAVTGLLVRPALAATGLPSPATTGAGSAVPATGHTTEVTVRVDGMAFTPSTIDVPAGDRLEATGSFKVAAGTKVVAVAQLGGKPLGSARFTLK